MTTTITQHEWTHHNATPDKLPMPERDRCSSYELWESAIMRWFKYSAGAAEQWQCKSLRLAIVAQDDGWAVCRLQPQGYPAIRVCVVSPLQSIEAIQAAMANVARPLNVPDATAKWEANIRKAASAL